MTSSGSGSFFLSSFMDANYRPDMSRQHAKEFAKQSVTLAMYRDNSSGGMIRLADITKNGVERETIRFSNLNNPKEY